MEGMNWSFLNSQRNSMNFHFERIWYWKACCGRDSKVYWGELIIYRDFVFVIRKTTCSNNTISPHWSSEHPAEHIPAIAPLHLKLPNSSSLFLNCYGAKENLGSLFERAKDTTKLLSPMLSCLIPERYSMALYLISSTSHQALKE